MIFYFTGTGNSLYVAKELDQNRISIPQVIKRERLVFSADSIGIVCPVYGHEMPSMVKEFIRRASFETEYLFVVLTYGAHHGGAAEIADLFFQACLDHVLIRCTGVLKPERHSVKTEGVVWCDKCRCGLVGLRHLDLMVSGVCVEETQ